ncbi:MAG: 3-hydroxyacyl-CoA dehydrogenase/enoyl-CoA hydratase family protein [Azonexus sp.]|nr:3-hydroxyacyl-CoA dehydrogenase/enoyl-CoA hydratase family protein [Azonexus sp.]MCK6410962.1 3-hydroxyacyl-CoA dehydrogenase/enoyl-CoA hydratase family protein [Azonexus sp.]
MNFTIRKAAVLGAGVMGAQIAAHLANADVPVLLFDLAGPQGDGNRVVNKALAGLKKLQPAPVVKRDRLQYIDAANYDEHLEQLRDCDLIIEAIAERMDWKNALYTKIGPFLSSTAIIASNTSGLSIAALADGLPEALRGNFCGIHFFNPPRTMPLVEIVPTPSSDAAMLDRLETWLTTRLGKGVIRALDTPNFVANRIGVFSLLATMRHAETFGLAPDTVDALTGPKIGRPKSATYRTGDVVGLDTLAHVVTTLHASLPNDPWHVLFSLPGWLRGLIERGALGQKSRGGVFRKQGKAIQVFDPTSGDYRDSRNEVALEVTAILGMHDPVGRLWALRTSSHPQAQFLWAIFRDLFHYCAVQLGEVAESARDLDLALRWGFGWAQGPFELWQAAGWHETAEAIAADIAEGRTLSSTPLPGWVTAPERSGVHAAQGSWSARQNTHVPRSKLPVYRRQIFPELLLGEIGARPESAGETLFENEGLRFWRLPAVDRGIGIVSFKTKMHALGGSVIEGMQAALAQAEAELDGLVIWHDAPFAVGADLKELMTAVDDREWAKIAAYIERFQQTTMAIKYAQVPVVAAVQGLALGGGCEFAMHAARRVMALESQLGLVEVGVGLIPAGGGCKELALRCARWAAESGTATEQLARLTPAFMAVATGKMAKNAVEAIDLGFAERSDPIRFHPRELLFAALKQARALADIGYAPAQPVRGVPVLGRAGIAAMEMTLVNMREGGMISAHDYRVSRAVAEALCGGEVEAGTLVDEHWLLAVERRVFLELLQTPETQARIRHLLDTGKALRN